MPSLESRALSSLACKALDVTRTMKPEDGLANRNMQAKVPPFWALLALHSDLQW
jgi:hypothetical protein